MYILTGEILWIELHLGGAIPLQFFTLSHRILTMFVYNQGRNFSSVMVNPNGKGYIVMATNIAKGVTIEVSNVIESIETATLRAMRFAGHSVNQPLDPDAVEQYLSERLGF